jgi:hypothetical protein
MTKIMKSRRKNTWSESRVSRLLQYQSIGSKTWKILQKVNSTGYYRINPLGARPGRYCRKSSLQDITGPIQWEQDQEDIAEIQVCRILHDQSSGSKTRKKSTGLHRTKWEQGPQDCTEPIQCPVGARARPGTHCEYICSQVRVKMLASNACARSAPATSHRQCQSCRLYLHCSASVAMAKKTLPLLGINL